MEKWKEYQDRYYKKKPWMRSWKGILNRTKKLKRYIALEFTITPRDLEEIWVRDRGYLLKEPSIDRRDNDKGYTKENCQFIEFSENRRKGSLGLKRTKEQNDHMSAIQKKKYSEGLIKQGTNGRFVKPC